MKPQLLLAALAVAFASMPALAQHAPKVGEPFPVQLFPQIGKKGLHSIADFRGKKVLLIQFASW